MERAGLTTLNVGNWRVEPKLGQMSRDGTTVRLEARTMRLLLCLAENAGEVVSVERLLNEVWAGVVVTPDSVYQAVTSLRRMLGDDARRSTYIATVPRMGYRMVVPVSSATEPPQGSPDAVESPRSSGRHSRRARIGLIGAFMACAILGAAWVYQHLAASGGPPASAGRSVAVLPFLDLTTQEMNEEFFADGVTEELINRLSKVGTLKVPSATASFYYKGKQVPLRDVAKALGVAYVVDGSIRKSGSTVRIAARLVRADDGYVRWAETYDRSVEDRLKVQEEIASAVARSLDGLIR